MRRITVIYLTAVFNLLGIAAFAQVNGDLLKTLSAVAGMRDRFPIEKVYLQLDKPYYTLGDTLRFKAYLMNGDFLKPSLKSGLLYVELDDENNKAIKCIMVPINHGISWGDIALDAKEFPEGSYTLRAYTNWMRNFGEDYIFKKNIYITALNGSLLVKTNFKLQAGAAKSSLTASIGFTGLDKNPFRLKDMQFKVLNGTHSLFSDKINTGMDGSVGLTFNLPDKSALKNLAITTHEAHGGPDWPPTLIIPVILNRPENADVQFMPEGGHLVGSLPIKVGFKAINEEGKGIPASGKVYDSKQQQVAQFTAQHLGMGSFEFMPQAGETYIAKVDLPGGLTKTYSLPAVNPIGTSLKISPRGKDSLEINIAATPDLVNAPATYFLIAQTRGLVCYTMPVSFKTSQVKKVIAMDLFPSGIAHFTLFNSNNQSLNERIYYVNHKDNLQVNLMASKPNYTIRDSITVGIAVTDNDNKPVRGSFSLAVTDNSQVKVDSARNIISNLFLTSDLKGGIEEPYYYFEKNTPERIVALDNLLLTQGWIGYNWAAIFNPVIQRPQYVAQPKFIVQGQVTNIFNKPVQGANVILYGKKPLIVKDTVTDKDGKFTFNGLFPIDTAVYRIQARNKRGGSNNVGLTVNEFVPSLFAASKPVAPWYVNSDTLMLNNAHTKAVQLKAEAEYKGEGHMLKEVVIKDKKIIKGSKNRNEGGGADITIDEHELEKVTHMSLFDLLKQKFKKDFYKKSNFDTMEYHLFIRRVYLIIDGVSIGTSPLTVDVYMDLLAAEDIKGIEIMRTSRYALAYDNGFIAKQILMKEKDVPIYLEITTYSGNGAYMLHTAGVYLYRTVPFTLPKDFYRPRYTAKNATTAIGTDLRSTIHWAPNVVTDKDGKATVSFYSADKPTDYTIILEGTDLKGAFGYSREKIKVIKK
ncbi:carboxypeptidase regulatory-like domain-containing protein [Mucilaginibacter sp.]|uniref:carboxypeptidase regulatory-like domain-containing protein n=1 Tax=Mucilaginibacter sp. TaxID=1882438 RepID=UPI002632B1B8|nr:carboxypeptidase regulatory-like domain-containing protein [Mucilaginibacter sp.]MDB4927430.1 hypothetical protein [Mucilaginibacter sp.]